MKLRERKSFFPGVAIDMENEAQKGLLHAFRVCEFWSQYKQFYPLTNFSLMPSTPQVCWVMGLMTHAKPKYPSK